jgi:copper chaperone
MITKNYTVQGMTCGHCAAAVTEEVNKIDGVESVAVDVESGTVLVVSSAELDPTRVAAAVEEAGYELVGA